MATRENDPGREERPGRPARESSSRRPSIEESERERSIRGRLESIVPEVVKRAMISGLGAIFMTEETIRTAVSDMPKDAVNFLVDQADHTKELLFTMIAKEVRDYLEQTDLNAEMARLLSRLTVEVRTQVRFIPNPDVPDSPAAMTPEVKHDVEFKRRKPTK
jgi:hypothetical protein